VISKEQSNKKTYRTYKIGNLVQIWMLEGRDYRTPNRVPDGPDKSIWGAEQLGWLKKTLLESDAVFKLLITPTPMIGPDDARKRDNHANINGFRTERDRFFTWIADNNFLNKNFYILCGDRHWQYHSIDSSGVEEFSCGAIVDQNARLGRIPGDSLSTDPKGLIKQPYSQKQASGGFLRVIAKPGATKGTSKLNLIFYDENGLELYRSEKIEKMPLP
jgi:alkaline phosphatase D